MQVTEFTPKDGINAKAHRKENSFQTQYTLVAIYKGNLEEIAQLRTYGTQSMNYVCLWIHDSKTNTHCNGSGRAGGYGYHRTSAAAWEAFNTAGITFDKNISGVGDGAMESALLAVGKKLGYKKVYLLKAHG